jgi:hypothetical protein
MKLNRAIAGYILAGIAMLLIFLYLRFPGEALRDYVTAVAAAGSCAFGYHGRFPRPSGGDPACG